MTHTQNCLLCEKVYENMNGYFLIEVNEPKDSLCSIPIKIQSPDCSINISLMTGSVYIGKINKPTDLYASISSRINSSAEYITINPNEFTHIEMDFEYSIYKNRHMLDKILLKKIEHKESIY